MKQNIAMTILCGILVMCLIFMLVAIYQAFLRNIFFGLAISAIVGGAFWAVWAIRDD
jgi:hypothetical protein